jgi:SAM-dependent methyltransferase
VDEASWDERYAGPDLVWTADANRFVQEECEPLTPGAALDLACGEGRNAVWLATTGWRVTAVDWSSVGLAKGAALAKSAGVEVEWVHADVLKWEAGRVYDLVLLVYLQLPPGQRRAALRKAADFTAPEGSILVIAHDLSNLRDGVGGPPSAEVLWTVDEVALDGFSPVRREVARRPTAAGIALDTVVRLQRVG